MAYAVVDFFFLLSGFVLAHTYGRKLEERNFATTFAKRRLLRLYPAYIVGSIAGAVALAPLVGIVQDWNATTYFWSWIAAVFFVPMPININLGVFPLNGPAWSLFFEGLVNVLFCLTAARLRPALVLVALSFPLLLLALKTWYAGGGSMWEDIWGGIPRVVFSFYLGVLIYILWKRGFRFPFSRAGLLVFVIFPLIYWDIWFSERRYNAFLIVIAHPIIVFVAAEIKLTGRLETVGRWLGDLSYPLYLVHVPVLFAVSLATGNSGGMFAYLGVIDPASIALCQPLFSLPVIALVLPLSIGFAHIYAYYVDPRIRGWLTANIGSKRSA